MTETRSAHRARTSYEEHTRQLSLFANRAARALAIAISLLGLAGCRASHAKEEDKNSSFPRAETFYLGGRQWGEPSTFNPLGTPGWPISTMNLLYETLL